MDSTIISYLSELEKNNNREWYHAHKAEYQAANRQFEQVIRKALWRLQLRSSGR